MVTFARSPAGKLFARLGVFAAIIVSGSVAVLLAGQAPAASTNGGSATVDPWVAKRTSWGDPDLQGIWTTDDEFNVPVERPRESPIHCRTPELTWGRPSIGMTRASWSRS